jgi:hypothetical protein
LATTDGKVVHLWEVASGARLRTLDGHSGEIRAVAFSQNGRLFATASYDSTVLIWDVTGRLQQGNLQPIQLPSTEAEARWRDLADNDGVKAHRAAWELAAAGDRAVLFLKDRLHPVAPPDPKHIARLISRLDSDEFADRQAAYADLKKLGELAQEQLSDTLKTNPSLEVRRRVEGLLQLTDEAAPSAERLRLIRAVAILESVASPAARRFLQSLAEGAPAAHLTRDARATFNRLLLTNKE